MNIAEWTLWSCGVFARIWPKFFLYTQFLIYRRAVAVLAKSRSLYNTGIDTVSKPQTAIVASYKANEMFFWLTSIRYGDSSTFQYNRPCSYIGLNRTCAKMMHPQIFTFECSTRCITGILCLVRHKMSYLLYNIGFNNSKRALEWCGRLSP